MATKTVEIDARVNTLRLERVLLLLAGLFLDIGVACSNTADQLRVDQHVATRPFKQGNQHRYERGEV